ncbi:MAG: MATE family efflux transporter [Dehalococcoidales bacterium]|nr:MATE family efflux transporter [Dehalococcoidales bacterium]
MAENKPNPVPPNLSKSGEGLLAQRMKKDWTEGSLFKNLWLISWPMTITQTLMSLGPTIDMIWVGRLGEVAIAGVGVSGVVVQLAQGAMMGLTAGMRALIARAIGAKDTEMAHRVAQHAVIISALYAVLMAIIGHFFAERIISFITTDPEIVAVGTMYMRIEFIGGATITFRMMMDAIMQASGDSVNPMQIAIFFRTFHIVLCPFLIFGWWIFPELGVRGAAYTSIIAQSLGVLLGLRVLFGAKSRLKLSFKGFRFDLAIIWRIIRIGFPALVSGIQRTLNQFILQKFLAPFGAAVLAAHQITQRIEMFLFMPAMSFGMGAGVLVGQNLGAKKPERAEKSAWLAVGVVEVFVIVVSALLIIFSGPVIHLFNSDPTLDATAKQFMNIAVFGWVLIGFMFVLMSSLQGAGDTWPTMLIQITTTWLITIPFAYFLPKYTNFGAVGIRWAITASAIVNALANILYFRTGRWKTKKV